MTEQKEPIQTQQENLELALAAGTPVGAEVSALSSAFSKSYNSYSGLDVKVIIGKQVMAEAQVIRVEENAGVVEGSIEYVIFQEDYFKSMLSTRQNITLAAADEYGNTAKMAIPDVLFYKWEFGLGIDDLILTAKLHFRGAEIIPWKKYPAES